MKMCVITDSLLTKASEPANTSVNTSTASSSAENTTSWTQLFRKPLKPKLTRKIVTSAKTNLNKYWSKFEEMMASDAITPENDPFRAHTSTRTSYRLMPPMLSALRRQRRPSTATIQYAAPPSPPASPLDITDAASSSPLMEFSFDRNNIADEINSLMAKRFTVEKNVARSSMYKHFNDDSLYHGVNFNGGEPMPRCSCGDNLSDGEEDTADASGSKYPFTHRNLSLSYEDKENLENEAMEVYTNLGYEISF